MPYDVMIVDSHRVTLSGVWHAVDRSEDVTVVETFVSAASSSPVSSASSRTSSWSPLTSRTWTV